MLGECIVYDYTCKYHYDPPFLYLIPDDLNQNGEMYRKLRDEIYSKKLITISTRKSYQHSGRYCFIVSNVILAMQSEGVRLDVAYYIERYADGTINQLRLTADVFTKFVEIPSHYYFRHESNKKLLESSDDLLYDYDTINRFDFTFIDVPVSATIKAGGILSNGIASNLKLKTYLVLTFAPQEDEEFIIKLAESVKKALCFLCYAKNADLYTMELANVDNGKPSINGVIRFNNNGYNEKYQPYFTIHSPYQYFQPQLGQFFNGVVNDKELYSRHLPSINDHYFDYDVIRLMNLFSAFENEYNRLPKDIRNKNSSNLNGIREIVIANVQLARSNVKNDLDKEFVDKSIQRIRQIDTTYSETQKIVNAYNYCADLLNMLLEFWGVNSSNIPDIAKRICALRDKIVHNNYEDSLEDHQTKLDIAFLEWITYAMLLHRYGLYDINKILKEMF